MSQIKHLCCKKYSINQDKVHARNLMTLMLIMFRSVAHYIKRVLHEGVAQRDDGLQLNKLAR